MSSEPTTKRPKRTQAKTPAKRTWRKYTPVEVETALLTLVHLGSNMAVSRELGIPEATIRKMKADHLDRYLELAEREAPKLERIAAQDALDIALRAKQVEERYIDRLDDEDLDPKDAAALSTVVRNLTTTRGITTDKRHTWMGRPAQIIENRTVDDIMHEMRTRFPGAVVNGTAEEITTPLLREAATGNAQPTDPT